MNLSIAAKVAAIQFPERLSSESGPEWEHRLATHIKYTRDAETAALKEQIKQCPRI